MRQLTKRERVLLLILLLLLVVLVPAVFLFQPMLKNIAGQTELLELFQEQRDQTQEVIANIAELRNQRDDAQQETDDLYNVMELTSTYDISLLISEICGKNGLTPQELSFTEYSQAELPAAVPELTAQAGEDASKADPYGLRDKTFVYTRTATVRLTGPEAGAYAFLDELTDYNPSMVVSGFTVGQGETGPLYEVRLTTYEFAGLERLMEETGGGDQ